MNTDKRVSTFSQAFQDVVGTAGSNTSLTHKHLSEERLRIMFTTVLHFAEERALREQVAREEERSAGMLNDTVKKVKERFKELSGETLKLNELSSNDSVELISTSTLSPRKVAYYRRIVDFEIK